MILSKLNRSRKKEKEGLAPKAHPAILGLFGLEFGPNTIIIILLAKCTNHVWVTSFLEYFQDMNSKLGIQVKANTIPKSHFENF